MRPQMLPTLSTQTSPQDEESDKLRKEIVKSLSPRASNVDDRHGLFPEAGTEQSSTDDPAGHGTRESTYLSGVYDNYWEPTNESESGPGLMEEKVNEMHSKPEPIQPGLAALQEEDQDSTAITPPIPPLSTRRGERIVTGTVAERPGLYANRFSWEAGPEQVSSEAAQPSNELQIPKSGANISYAATPDTQLRELEVTREAYFEQGPISTSSANTPGQEEPLAPAPRSRSPLRAASTISDRSEDEAHPSSESHGLPLAAPVLAGVVGAVGAVAGAAGVVAGAAGVVAGVASHILGTDQANETQERSSLTEPKGPEQSSSHSVSPTAPEDEQASQPGTSSVGLNDGFLRTEQPMLNETQQSRLPQRMSADNRIMPFHEITAFQQPEQRIRAFDDTRHQFASMETGLSNWLVFVSNQAATSGAGSWPGSTNISNLTIQSKVTKSSSPGGLGTPLQQPYYQQYLNASPSSSVPQISRPATGITAGTQQGFSTSGGVQGKGKELLHTAGIFGGKASKAGKGLLAKGKNKLRGSGGGDKVD
jgi:hypothetical protein